MYSADVALAEALARLKAVEEDNMGLKSKLKQMVADARAIDRAEGAAGRAGGGGGGGDIAREVERLRKQNSEVRIQRERERGGRCSFSGVVY